jgi:hypothetical protein
MPLPHPATDPCEFTVRLLGSAGRILGSGVLVAPRWVLSVSHVLSSPQAFIAVESADHDQAEVLAMHWPPAGSYRLGGQAQWPPLPGAADDQPVLLRLARALGPGRRPALDGAAAIGVGMPLWLRSWGVDALGNYPQAPRALPLRAQPKDPGRPRFGLAAVTPGRAPRQGHSGGGVFAEGRLLGLHSHRRLDREPEQAAYLALDPPLIHWLETTLQEAG